MKKIAWLISLFISYQLHAIEGGKLADTELMLKTGTVAVLLNGKDSIEACTGVRVAPNVVLTAGHCVASKSPIGVRQSLNHLNSTVPIEQIEHVYIPLKNFYYRKYFDFESDDIAVLVLRESSPNPFLKIKAYNKKKIRYMQLGYGRSNVNIKSNSVLHYLEDAKVSMMKGQHTLEVINTKTTGVRKGDSGGPLLGVEGDNFYVLGTLVAAEDVNLEGKARRATYNASSTYLKWMRSVIKLSSFQEQLGEAHPQYVAEETSTPIDETNRTTLLEEACMDMGLSHPVKWVLNKYLSCLPQDRNLCFIIKTGRFGNAGPNLYLEWDEANGTCTE